nr:hypothetical protein CFP56_23957 [Quercus suber]
MSLRAIDHHKYIQIVLASEIACMAGTRYRSFSGALVDPEKPRRSYDSDDAPSLVSYEVSSSHPMLGKQSSGLSFAYHLPRRRFSRYFTFTIGSILLFFILYLVRSSWANQAEIQRGLKKPPAPPPAWEQFPFLTRYHGGIRKLVSREENKPEYPVSDEAVELQRLQDAAAAHKSTEDAGVTADKDIRKRESGFASKTLRFNPYPEYESQGYLDKHERPVHCYVDNKTQLEVPQLLAYKGVTEGFPDPVYGSHKLLGLRDDVCFERFGRLSPYGYGYSHRYGGSGAGMEDEKEGSEAVWNGELEIDYRKVDWAEAQQQCVRANAHRFKADPKPSNHLFASSPTGRTNQNPGATTPSPNMSTSENGKELLPRTVLLLRTWSDYEYDKEDLFFLRALVNELSIQSGAEYVVHFLIHVKDDDTQIWADEETYQQVLDKSLPAEFHGMGTLWSERQMALIYGGLQESNFRELPVHGAYRSKHMAVQYFAHMHPEYDFFWHWEMDIRYTGHYYHLFAQVAQWARQQPRKGLWERNERFYVPSEHGSWDDYKHLVRVQIEHGTASKQNIYGKLSQDAAAKHPLDEASRKPDAPVWGALRPTGVGDETVEPANDPGPPTPYDMDDYTWGVGEEADLITFNPLFDPQNTNWILAEDVTGYNTSDGTLPPRRAAVITASRLSRRLLETMHRETALKRHTMFSEMWPASCALHHGYKAVYAPHPVYIDRAWPTSYLAAIFNNGKNGASGGARTSIFSEERQHNFLGTSWYYHAGFSPNLWKRWLGYKIDNDGGQEWESANEGRMCLPAMLLHPVKQVDLVYEHKIGEA